MNERHGEVWHQLHLVSDLWDGFPKVMEKYYHVHAHIDHYYHETSTRIYNICNGSIVENQPSVGGIYITDTLRSPDISILDPILYCHETSSLEAPAPRKELLVKSGRTNYPYNRFTATVLVVEYIELTSDARTITCLYTSLDHRN
jgi:hypothetical protein